MAETTARLESKWTMEERQQGLGKTFNYPADAKALINHSIADQIAAKVYLGLHTTYPRGDQIYSSSP